MSAAFTLHGRHVDPSLNRITAGHETRQVEPKIMQVLAALAERPGEVVTRDELMERVWPGVFVTDDVLHRAIRELRRIFDDDPEHPRVIETIRKRGYRLVAPVELPQTASRAAAIPIETTAPNRMLKAAAAGVALLLVSGGFLFWIANSRRSPVATEARVRFVPFTSEPGNEIDPALSPSGRLAYVARGADGRGHIFTKVSAESAAVQVTHGETVEHGPAWSTDEMRLAFVRMTGQRCAIWTMSMDSREARELSPCRSTSEFRMSWSPDGRLLAVTADAATRGAASHIEVVDMATGDLRPVTEPPPSYSGDWSPAFSPDSREIAFVRTVSGSVSDVFIALTAAKIAGGPDLRRVTFDNADVLGVDWEPDGRHLVFASERAGGISLWRVAAEGGEPSLLAGGGAKLKHPSVARRSGAVAYEDWHYEINLLEQPIDAGEASRPRTLSPTSDRWNFHPQLSPDGTRLVFQSTRSGQYELWVSDRDGVNARPLTRSGGYKSPARWSPDGRRVAFITRVGGGSDLSILDVDSGAIRRIVNDPASASAPAWSHDGRSVYFGSLRTGTWQVWNVEADSGRLRQVTIDGGYAAIESLDGRWLYYARFDRRGLLRRAIHPAPPSSQGEQDAVVIADVRAEDWPNWGVTDDGVFFLARPDEGDPQVTIAAGDGTNRRPLARLANYAWSGIAMSRDGSRVIYAHADRRDANIGGLTLMR